MFILPLQLVKMFAVVVTIFMVCWAPYHIYFLYSYHHPSITKIPYIHHIYLGFYWLAMCNTCVNPIIYYWMNKRFRSYFNSILFCVPRYLTRAASGSWPVDGFDSPTRITRTQSCPQRHRCRDPISTIPVRSIHMSHSSSVTNRPFDRYSSYSVRSRDSILTRVNFSEEQL